MKLFEIGDGLKSIKVSNNYYSELENEGTIMLYDPKIENVWIRITVLSVKPKRDSDLNFAYQYVIDNGKKDNRTVKTVNEKSYFSYAEDTEENGEKFKMFFFIIGYKCNHIIISICSLLEEAEGEKVKQIINDMERFIPSIEEIATSKMTIFSPKCADYKEINKRISKILNIMEQQIDDIHEKDESILLIQKAIDENKYQAGQTYEWQSLGIALGDYIQYKNHNFHWAIVRDEYGRDLSLQYKNLSLAIFPMTMISKRIEDKKQVNVIGLINEVKDTIEKVVENGNYTQLDYND